MSARQPKMDLRPAREESLRVLDSGPMDEIETRVSRQLEEAMLRHLKPRTTKRLGGVFKGAHDEESRDLGDASDAAQKAFAIADVLSTIGVGDLQQLHAHTVTTLMSMCHSSLYAVVFVTEEED
jgi:hypothetical protein